MAFNDIVRAAGEGPLALGAPEDDLLALYAQMRRVRAMTEEAISLQRQGALTGLPPGLGQEAAQVGSAAALDARRDFAFPTYRELGAMITMGVPPLAIFAHFRGVSHGGAFDVAEHHVAPLNSVVGGTALHGVGWAMGAKLDGDDACAIVYFGDGASSQGEVHEAMNFAGVFELPVIFFCQNNGWAISVPVAAQVGGGSVAARADGYGLAGERIDGDDVLAVRDATARAVERARSGGGATVIEAITYRRGPHSTSDDPSRYRSREDEQAWADRDPLLLAERRLRALRPDADARIAATEAAVAEELDQLRSDVSQLTTPSLRDQVALAYVRTPPAIAAANERWLGAIDA
jgi:pyruvate dehydrogenase E1 component alpha subunit